jgi:excinuclease UvrABC ATPase subunit
MGPEAGDGGGKIVVEGPPEDLVVHVQQCVRDKSLLRSHTGEALEAFGLR